jgi:hypothetical protein
MLEATARMTHNPHDALFKSTFSDPRHAEGAIRGALPPALAARVDWSTLELQPGSFVDDGLKDRHADLLFRARIGERLAFFYLLYEHQSRPHPLMPLRILGYAVRIWEDWLAENPNPTRIPALLPVVLHHGEGGWTAARSIEDLYDLDPEALAAAGELVPRFRFALDDIGHEGDDALRARAMTALGRLVLYCFRHARDPAELIRGLARCWDLLNEVYAAPNGVAALGTVWRYILLIHGEPPEVVLTQLAAVTPDPIQEKIMTAGEVLIERGRIEGERKGEQKGQMHLIVRAYERGLRRPLADGERTTLAQRLERLGADRLFDMTYDLPPDALAAWLADPSAT